MGIIATALLSGCCELSGCPDGQQCVNIGGVSECVEEERLCLEDPTFDYCGDMSVPADAGQVCDDGVEDDEVCDGVDNDCDGLIDEDLDGPIACYTGPPGTQGVGECQRGSQMCIDGMLTDCVGSRVPAEQEMCDGLDNDCDDFEDEGADGGPLTETCEMSPTCQGLRTCMDGMWGPCEGGGPNGEPVGEVCNGIDDDCDGTADEAPQMGDPEPEDPNRASELVGQGDPCVARDEAGEPLRGACLRYGTRECEVGERRLACHLRCGERGSARRCMAEELTPSSETCGADVSRPMRWMPDSEVIEEPGKAPFEVIEIDWDDEDCDGVRDNFPDPACAGEACGDVVLGEPCGEGVGACRAEGVYTCGMDGMSAECTSDGMPLPEPEPEPETCNGEDDDCDGAVDEGVTEQCGSDVGLCEFGVRLCMDGRFDQTTCPGETPPRPKDWCDGYDDDCDGSEQGCTCDRADGDGPPLVGVGSSEWRTAPRDSDRADALRSTCGGDGARDLALVFTAPNPGGVYRFRQRSSDPIATDPVLSLTRQCASAVKETFNAGDEIACGDDDGALPAPGDMLPAALAPISPRGATVAAALGAGEEVTVVLDGYSADDEGEGLLDIHRIDAAQCGVGGGVAEDEETVKRIVIAGAVPGAARFIDGTARCDRRQVTLDKVNRGAPESEIGQGLCADNDGAFRAVQLETAARGALARDETVHIVGHLLPRAVDEADWYSIGLVRGGRRIEVLLEPSDAVRDGLDDPPLPADGVDAELDAVLDDSRRCLGRWSNLALYLGCTAGTPNQVGDCADNAVPGMLVCRDDENACADNIANRRLGVDVGQQPCTDPAGQLVAFVGVLRRQTAQAVGCDCNNNDAAPDRCASYALSITYR